VVSKVLVVGDIHGNWTKFINLINQENPEVILQVGDFGWWGDENDKKIVFPKNTSIYFCDGNHENHPLLNTITNDITNNLHYMKRGSILTINNYNILFIGGGESPDQRLRTPGYDYFHEESITQKDIDNLPDIKIDIIISHTCPSKFKVSNRRMRVSELALDHVLEKYNPKRWYFGHWHFYKRGHYKDCYWICLNEIKGTHNFVQIDV
jgi:Icc-related predicted phosphoesterase